MTQPTETNDSQNSSASGDLIIDFGGMRIATFLGAGISAAPPSDLPLWPDFRDHLLKNLTSVIRSPVGPDESEAILANLDLEVQILRIKPESLLQVVLDVVGEYELSDLLSALRASCPNKNHFALARLCREQKLRCLVTTNFDSLIEIALKKVGFNEIHLDEADKPLSSSHSSFAVIATEDEWAHPALMEALQSEVGPVLVLKPHGTLDEGGSRGLIATLKRAAMALSSPKREVLSYVIEHYPILVAGYSGNDDDIYPFLLSLVDKTKKLLWNFRPGQFSGPTSRGHELLSRLGTRGVPLEYDIGTSSLDGNQLFDVLYKAYIADIKPDSVDISVAADTIETKLDWKSIVEQWCRNQSAADISEIIGGFWEHVGDLSKAYSAYTRSITASKQFTKDIMARLQLKAGRVCLGGLPEGSDGQINVDEAISRLDQAIKLAADSGHVHLEAEAELLLATALYFVRSKGDWNLHFSRCEELAKSSNYPEILPKFHYYLAFTENFPFVKPGEYEQKLRAAIQAADVVGDVIVKARASRVLARSILANHDLNPDEIAPFRKHVPPPPPEIEQEAKALLLASATICQDIGDYSGLRDSKRLLANLFRSCNSEDDFIVAWRDIYEIDSQLGNDVAELLAQVSTAELALRNQDCASAERSLDAALSLAPNDWDQSGDSYTVSAMWSLAEQLAMLGCAQANRIQFDNASESFAKANRIFTRVAETNPDYFTARDGSGYIGQIEDLQNDLPSLNIFIIATPRDLSCREIERLRQVGDWCTISGKREIMVVTRDPTRPFALIDMLQTKFSFTGRFNVTTLPI